MINGEDNTVSNDVCMKHTVVAPRGLLPQRTEMYLMHHLIHDFQIRLKEIKLKNSLDQIIRYYFAGVAAKDAYFKEHFHMKL